MPESDSNSWTSSSRHGSPLIAYSDPPFRNRVREIVTSAYSMGRAPSELSMVSATSALPSGARPVVPAKMTSSILPPRSDFAPCSPMTHANASTTLDLPEPFGPTTQVTPGSNCRVVDDAKDLKPFRVKLLRCTVLRSLWGVGNAARSKCHQTLSGGRRWHLEQEKLERFMNRSRLMCPPHRGQGSPSRP